jgi:hypothetical protein
MVPTARVSHHLAGLLAACVIALRARYAHPGGAALAGTGAALTLALSARVCWCTARALAASPLRRRIRTPQHPRQLNATPYLRPPAPDAPVPAPGPAAPPHHHGRLCQPAPPSSAPCPHQPAESDNTRARDGPQRAAWLMRAPAGVQVPSAAAWLGLTRGPGAVARSRPMVCPGSAPVPIIAACGRSPRIQASALVPPNIHR